MLRQCHAIVIPEAGAARGLRPGGALRQVRASFRRQCSLLTSGLDVRHGCIFSARTAQPLSAVRPVGVTTRYALRLPTVVSVQGLRLTQTFRLAGHPFS